MLDPHLLFELKRQVHRELKHILLSHTSTAVDNICIATLTFFLKPRCLFGWRQKEWSFWLMERSSCRIDKITDAQVCTLCLTLAWNIFKMSFLNSLDTMFLKVWNGLKLKILDLRNGLKSMTGMLLVLVLRHLSARSRGLLLALPLSLIWKLQVPRLLSDNLSPFLIHHTDGPPSGVVRNNFSEGSISQLHVWQDIHSLSALCPC
jgi:hypothetical protein